MLRFTGHYITCQEVPGEVSLTLTISGCPYRCRGCHSPWLRNDIGDRLTTDALFRLMARYHDGITCVCFMGDGGDAPLISEFIRFVHECGYKACLYTGDSEMTLLSWSGDKPDYYKVGPYDDTLGGLDSPTTNQRMYRYDKVTGLYKDITSLFWKEKT